MKKSKKSHRLIASFLLVIFFPSILPLNLLYASNNGPVSPEASSFEPVDAKDMVNLATGDMSYVLPLLNVPSPEGGYPLSLSNHAGIAVDQEASWVGLGWSLNPGAINRGVSGVPDDWKDRQINQIVFDAGGVVTSYSASISVGWGGVYSAGLYGSYSENKTLGGTTSYSTNGGVTASIGLTDSFGISAKLGTNGVGLGVGISKKDNTNNTSTGFGLEVNQSFQDGSTTTSGGIFRDQNGISFGVGISFNSINGLSESVSVSGFSMSGNSYSNARMTVSTQSYNISFPIYALNIGLGFSKSKYWTYQNNYTKYNGSLYAGNMITTYNEDFFRNTISFDSYNSIYKLDCDEQQEQDNLSYVGYDSYSVSAQGIGGSMKPNIFEQGSLINNYKGTSTNNNTISYKNGINNSFTKSVDVPSNDIHFYFENELSSYLKNSSSNWNLSVNPDLIPTQMSPNSDQNSNTTIDDEQYNGFDSVAKRKRTGNYIEVFTNKEITDSNGTNIINSENFNRSLAPKEGIGAFRITSIDGKVYHYSIPVYQKEQFTKFTNIGHNFQTRYLEKQQLIPYATHWLLTAITGPDYIDVNHNNKVDQGDYGYWTSLDYGKWSDGYAWRTNEKSNDKSKSYQWGVKEIYYLDKIKTRTHTAIFIKDVRLDDLAYKIEKVGKNENDLEWKKTVNRSFIKGKDNLLYFNGIYNNPLCDVQNLDLYDIPEQSFGQYMESNSHRSLKLNKILLFKNEDVSITKNNSPANVSVFKGQIKIMENFKVWRLTSQLRKNVTIPILNDVFYGEFYNNVFDVSDLTPATQQKAIKSINFNYSYQLAKNSVKNSSAPSKGRLTLESVNFLGSNEAQVMPPYKFGYVNTLNYDETKEDNWGYYSGKNDEWSLNKISTPTGSEIGIVYETDDIDKEAVTSYRGIDSNVEFIFGHDNNNLYITMQNEFNKTDAIDFRDFFQVGTVSLDLWASIKHDYHKFLKGCKARKGAIDIMPNSPNVEITNVTQTQVFFKATMANTYSDNNGLNWFCGKIVGIENHPHMILGEVQLRNTFGEPPGCINVTDRLVLLYKLLANKNESSTPSGKEGGGLRVSEVSVSEGSEKKNILKYYYNVPGFGEKKSDSNYKSSGITSFIPHKYFKEIKYMSELPSPMVMYEYVTVKSFSEDNKLATSEEYNFEVLKPDSSTNANNLTLANSLEISKDQEAAFSNRTSINPDTNTLESYQLNYSKFNIKDMTSGIGRLKQKKVFNSKQQMLSKENYVFKSISDINQGVSEESFNTYKKISRTNSKNYRLSVTSKVKYPSMLERLESTQASFTAKTYYDSYDFLTGQLTDTRFMSSDGKIFKSKLVPAYKRYSGMGAKVDDINNKNMLSQQAIQYSYIFDLTGAGSAARFSTDRTWKEIGAKITTWSNDWNYKGIDGETETPPVLDNEKIWRIHKTYTWNGYKDSNGIFYDFSRNDDDGFVWDVGVGQPLNSKWKQISENTLYNHYSAPLETKDLNGNYASSKMGDNETKVMAIGNARYNEMFYAGAENITDDAIWLEPEVKMINASRNNIHFHTGRQSVAATSSSQFGVLMKIDQHREGKYKVSVWVEKANEAKATLKVNGTSVNFITDNIVAGNWKLKTAYIDVPLGNCTVYLNSSDPSSVYFDDLMIRPVASTITGYVYNERDELTSIIGNNGLATKYEYDAAGRLIKAYVEVVDDSDNGVVGGFKLAKTNTYNNRLLN